MNRQKSAWIQGACSPGPKVCWNNNAYIGLSNLDFWFTQAWVSAVKVTDGNASVDVGTGASRLRKATNAQKACKNWQMPIFEICGSCGYMRLPADEDACDPRSVTLMTHTPQAERSRVHPIRNPKFNSIPQVFLTNFPIPSWHGLPSGIA